MTPAGLASVQPGFLQRVIALYALLAVFVLGFLALIAQPRGGSPHLHEQEARRPAATGAAADVPGRSHRRR